MLTIPDEIKELFHQDTCKKNIRIHFPNDERSDICNDLIVMDSVQFTESLCSRDQLKFGLCEAPVFECEVVGVGNIKGATIEVFCEIFCPSTVSDAVFRPDLQEYVYPIPYGTFIVESSPRQADINHRKVKAYGGQANINCGKNKTLHGKWNARYTTAVNYVPDIFKSFMTAMNTYERLSEATYTDVTDHYYQRPDYFMITSSRIRNNMWKSGQLVSRYSTISVSQITTNKLYFFEATKIKTKEEVMAEVNQYIQDLKNQQYGYDLTFIAEELSAYLDKHPIFLCGLSSFPSAMQEGRYLYPYQSIDEDDLDFDIYMACGIGILSQQSPSSQGTLQLEVDFIDPDSIKLYEVDTSNYPQYSVAFPRNIVDAYGYYRFDESEVDFLKAMEGAMELIGEFGYINRSNDYESVNIKRQFGLIPDSDLYPGTNVYPEGVTGGKLLPGDYQSCWYDEKYSKPFGRIRCAYTNTSNENIELLYYLNGYNSSSDENSYQTYDLSDNYVIQHNLWTSSEIQEICGHIADNIDGVSYVPVEFVGRGLPYVEAGDTFEILTASNDSITTIVLNRTISGEQVLTDSYKSV